MVAFVVSVAGAALAGLIAGAFVATRGARERGAVHAETLGELARAETKLEAANTARIREKDISDDLRQVVRQKDVEVAGLREHLAVANTQINNHDRDTALVQRELSSLRSRFHDIAGLEAENATLRVIATKVAVLEERLQEHEPDDPAVIDLRENRREYAE